MVRSRIRREPIQWFTENSYFCLSQSIYIAIKSESAMFIHLIDTWIKSDGVRKYQTELTCLSLCVAPAWRWRSHASGRTQSSWPWSPRCGQNSQPPDTPPSLGRRTPASRSNPRSGEQGISQSKRKRSHYHINNATVLAKGVAKGRDGSFSFCQELTLMPSLGSSLMLRLDLSLDVQSKSNMSSL